MMQRQTAILPAIAHTPGSQTQCSEGPQQVEIFDIDLITGMHVQSSLNDNDKEKKTRGSDGRSTIANGGHLAGTGLVINHPMPPTMLRDEKDL